MPKVYVSGSSVYEIAKQRYRDHLLAGDRIVVSSSGGKDSTIIMELLIEVQRELGMLPVDVVTRDEEAMYPGTFEYLERVAQRPEVRIHWVIAGQAIVNAFDRFHPYWWVFDPDERAKWMRTPPPYAEWIDTQNIDYMTTPQRFPPPEGGRLIAAIGLRAQESLTRLTRIASTGGALTKRPNAAGVYTLAPIYDWLDDDVWKAIGDLGWDYNRAYDAMFRAGVPRSRLRIAPPSMKQNIVSLPYAAKLWPQWFDKLDNRIPGMRAAAYYGKRALTPALKPGETWQTCYDRLMKEAEDAGAGWLVNRMILAREAALQRRARHSASEYPMLVKNACRVCPPKVPGSWEALCKTMYQGDPWRHYNQELPNLEPYEVRPGAKAWTDSGKKVSLHW